MRLPFCRKVAAGLALLLALPLAADQFTHAEYTVSQVDATGACPRTGRINVNVVTGERQWCNESLVWASGGGAPGSIPSGVIVLSLTTCPATFTEVAALSGKFVLGTVAASADVGGTGGSDTITSVLNHTHPVTDPGHTHGELRFPTATGGSSGFTADTSMSGTPTAVTQATASATTGVTTSNPAGGVASIDNRPAFVKVIFCSKD